MVLTVSSTISSLIVPITETTKNNITTSLSIGILLSSTSGFYRIFGWISLYSNKFIQFYSPLLHKVNKIIVIIFNI